MAPTITPSGYRAVSDQAAERSAPWPPPARVPARQALIDQPRADARSIDQHDPQLAPVFVRVAVDRLQADGAVVEQLAEPPRRLVAELLLGRAARLVGLGRVDVR